jgi:hypothetical protein
VRIILTLLTISLVACGSKPAPQVGADPGPVKAVQQFMQAVADSNFNRMAELWGTAKGPAAETGQPPDYQKRVSIMWAYLKGTTAKVLGEVEHGGGRSVLAVEVSRGDCRKRVPFTVVQTDRGAWVINAIELGLVGAPGTPCPSEERRPNTP